MYLVRKYLDRNFGLRISLSEINLLFDLRLDLDQTLAQRKAKSKVKVTQPISQLQLTCDSCSSIRVQTASD